MAAEACDAEKETFKLGNYNRRGLGKYKSCTFELLTNVSALSLNFPSDFFLVNFPSFNMEIEIGGVWTTVGISEEAEEWQHRESQVKNTV